MNEVEWGNSDDLALMLNTAWNAKRSSRKIRLFACACCRRIWRLLSDPRSRDVVDVTERHADGTASDIELSRSIDLASDADSESFALPLSLSHAEGAAANVSGKPPFEPDGRMVTGVFTAMTPYALTCASDCTFAVHYETHPENCQPFWNAPLSPEQSEERRIQCQLLRDVFGNPFRTESFDTAWRTSAAVLIAEAIYQGREFNRLPELADELQCAGCRDVDVLAHCRAPGPHVRGCWAVDLILEKA